MSEIWNHFNMHAIARDTLLRFGFLVETPPAALAQLANIDEPDCSRPPFRDMTTQLWSSIDNDDSRDLDQIEYIEQDGRGTRLFVGIADVVASVERATPLDEAARHNTTSIYTGVRTFPMLPEKLSANLTSLLEGQTRLAVVTEMRFSSHGHMEESTAYRAVVRNQCQLTYNAVAAWLEDQMADDSAVTRSMLGKIRDSQVLQDQLRRQSELAEALRERRLEAGALTFETIELHPERTDGRFELKAARHNTATRLIEDFMIAANQANVSCLESKGFPTLRRIVRTPKNWPQIIKLAAERGTRLPAQPDPIPLEVFLTAHRRKDPDRFPELSLAIIKLLGRGEYAVAQPGREAPGHFALAVEGYAHSTAPNRRYPDIITQRLLQACFAGHRPGYSIGDLAELAEHCTQKENDANKAERSVNKSIAAAALSNRIGENFHGMITGAAEKGVWVRIVNPPVEGRLHGDLRGLAVGDKVTVQLASTDPWKGYIDFDLIARR
ncbi:MAG: RNB domain-containing ribonuclease [Acidobacteria bacterium]|nr:RNB domain-containing ribonuclease [Acidobacteriota bacterium]